MANFQTHITAGVLTSGVLSTAMMAAGVASPRDAILLTVAGTVGSILPDIDLEQSRQSKAIFGGFGIFFAFIVLFRYSQMLSIAELSILWLGIYISIRYLLWKLFNAFTMHRGLFHSLLANAFFGMVGASVFYYLLQETDVVAWMGGTAVFIGALTHLVLDEIYSIDFAGNRVKRSFGTALKLFDYQHPGGAILMALCLFALIYSAPPAHNFYALVKAPGNWAYLQSRLLPADGKWFDLEALRTRLAHEHDPEPPLTTGSID